MNDKTIPMITMVGANIDEVKAAAGVFVRYGFVRLVCFPCGEALNGPMS